MWQTLQMSKRVKNASTNMPFYYWIKRRNSYNERREIRSIGEADITESLPTDNPELKSVFRNSFQVGTAYG